MDLWYEAHIVLRRDPCSSQLGWISFSLNMLKTSCAQAHGGGDQLLSEIKILTKIILSILRELCWYLSIYYKKSNNIFVGVHRGFLWDLRW